MATKTVTIDTGEWKYPDVTGITHTVTNGQTFTFTLTDTSTTDVRYYIDVGGKLTTTDGLTIYLRPMSDGGNQARWIGKLADSMDGTAYRSHQIGELLIECPKTGIIQIWTPSSFNVNNVDAPTAITATFEDQFGNSFTWSAVTIS